MSGAFAFHPLGVFDEQGNAFEGAGFGATPGIDLFGGFGLGKGFIEVAVGQAIDPGFTF